MHRVYYIYVYIYVACTCVACTERGVHQFPPSQHDEVMSWDGIKIFVIATVFIIAELVMLEAIGNLADFVE